MVSHLNFWYKLRKISIFYLIEINHIYLLPSKLTSVKSVIEYIACQEKWTACFEAHYPQVCFWGPFKYSRFKLCGEAFTLMSCHCICRLCWRQIKPITLPWFSLGNVHQSWTNLTRLIWLIRKQLNLMRLSFLPGRWGNSIKLLLLVMHWLTYLKEVTTPKKITTDPLGSHAFCTRNWSQPSASWSKPSFP